MACVHLQLGNWCTKCTFETFKQLCDYGCHGVHRNGDNGREHHRLGNLSHFLSLCLPVVYARSGPVTDSVSVSSRDQGFTSQTCLLRGRSVSGLGEIEILN